MRPPALLLLLPPLISACSSPPQPPTVDAALKRPANSAMAVELQVCTSDLHNTRIVANEASRYADLAAARLDQLLAWQQAVVLQQAAAQTARSAAPASAHTPSPAAAPGNAIFTVEFALGSTRVLVPAGIEPALLSNARTAPQVVLRSRSGGTNSMSGTTNNAAQNRLDQARAIAVRDYLVGAGVSAARVRTTQQLIRDDGNSAGNGAGPAHNRRVEIEVYRVMPFAMPVAVPVAIAALPNTAP
jgi:hypothetical protein